MFKCDNQDSCLLYLNGGQRNICEANNHGQITDSQWILRHSPNLRKMFLTAQAATKTNNEDDMR